MDQDFSAPSPRSRPQMQPDRSGLAASFRSVQAEGIGIAASQSSVAISGGEALPGAMSVRRSDRPLKIAIVYSRLPLPMERADQMTVAHLIAFLAQRGHVVDLWTLGNGEATTAAQHAWLKRVCRRVEVFNHRLPRRLVGTLAGLLDGLPLQCGWFANARQRAVVRDACASGDYDIVYAYLIRSAEAVRGIAPADGRRPATFLAMQVSQALNTRRIFERSDRLRDKLIYGLEYRLTRRYEARIWSDFTRTVLISPQDARAIESLCREAGRAPINNYIYGPHGVDLERFAPSDVGQVDAATVVFCGSLKTNTNIEAITWFVNRVWPLVIAARPGARLLIVGRSPTAGVRRLERTRGVEVIGEVATVQPFLGRAAVCIDPVRACAGQQNKLLEYMAMAKATVATSFANEGIGAMDGRDLLLADTPRAFADQVVLLLDDAGRRAALGKAARAFVAANWSWGALFLKLERAFYDSLDGRPPEHVEAISAPSSPPRAHSGAPGDAIAAS